mmetsp:Transcript_13175/g.19173  ORF Transcript_13175/g.19173 Transcript_13175/m.19173 type:complete len:141 (+) Transcript_13175:294-716(+)
MKVAWETVTDWKEEVSPRTWFPENDSLHGGEKAALESTGFATMAQKATESFFLFVRMLMEQMPLPTNVIYFLNENLRRFLIFKPTHAFKQEDNSLSGSLFTIFFSCGVVLLMQQMQLPKMLFPSQMKTYIGFPFLNLRLF